jgi:predicted outer membrane repeat protein
MYNLSCSPTLTNVTISGNSATTSGGGIFNTQSNPTLTNITIFGNNATTSGGGMYNENQSSPTVTNSIYWANTPDQIVNITSSSTDVSYSDIQNWASGGTGNIKTNPLLDETLFKGSDIFTQTHALLAGSPAIDTANPTTCPTYDQRYFARPIDGDNVPGAVCDMGAFEYASTVDGFKLNVTVVGGGSVVKNPNKDGYVFGEAITLTAVPIPGWTFSHWSGDVPDTANPLTNPLTMNIRGITNITANFVSKIYLPLILKN